MKTYIEIIIGINLLANFFIAGIEWVDSKKEIKLLIILLLFGGEIYLASFLIYLFVEIKNWLAGITQISFYIQYFKGTIENANEDRIEALSKKVNILRKSKKLTLAQKHMIYCVGLLNKKYNYKIGE